MPRILVIHYSQTGQLTRTVRSMLEPLGGLPEVCIDWHEVRPLEPFPFPWRWLTFFDAFPESVYLDPPAVEPAPFDADAPYDLVVLAYQVWFLSPSLPITGFLASPDARVLAGKNVITLIVCRNMWVSAHRTMRDWLARLGARVVDHVVLTDDSPMWSTFITTPWWMMTGNRHPFPAVLPPAGLDERQIARAARFGRALRDALPAWSTGAAGPFLRGLSAVRVNPTLLLAERIGQRSFRVWGALVRACGKPGAAARKPVLLVYSIFLLTIIVTVLPFTATLAWLLGRYSKRVREEAAALESPSGSGDERMTRFGGDDIPSIDS